MPLEIVSFSAARTSRVSQLRSSTGLSDVFLATGAVGIGADFFAGCSKEMTDTERHRCLLKEAAPGFRYAVTLAPLTASLSSIVRVFQNK